MGSSGIEVAVLIAAADLTIYDDLTDMPECFYDLVTLQRRLERYLVGLNLDYPIRTRAKKAKEQVAAALGYPIPRTFEKTQPRFPGQNMDVFVQMADNLQIWNEEVDPGRRYVLIRVGPDHVVTAVRVLTGEAIALLDRTGTLTSKYQAKRRGGSAGSKLVSATDTTGFLRCLGPAPEVLPAAVLESLAPTATPVRGAVLSIAGIYARLQKLVGEVFDDPGSVQERNRGVVLQRLVCEALGLGPYGDGGQFPDVLCQVLEVKFQLSPTVDLGLVTPDSMASIQEAGVGVRHRDARYAVVYGSRLGGSSVRVDSVVVSTGEDFFTEFQRFEGLVQNRKLQIPLPKDLFDTE